MLAYSLVVFAVVVAIRGANVTTTANVTSAVSTYTTCKANLHFECVDKSHCLPLLDFCNGIKQCTDGSDELRYNYTLQAGLPGRSCARKTVNGTKALCYITKPHVCNDEVDCYFGNDECGCTTALHCTPLPGQPKTCRVRSQFCNIIPDCPSGSDEQKYATGLPGLQCAVTKRHVTSHCMLPQVHVCDGINDCDEGTDECFCNATGNGYLATGFLHNNCFRCLDGSTIIKFKRVCDMSFHCGDLSDECLCLRKRPPICRQVCKYGESCGNCTVGQVMCSRVGNETQKCINRSQVCNRVIDCPNKEDENNCAVKADQVFYCADGLQYVEKYMHCDNYKDCNDGSDEWNCSTMYKCRRPGYSTTRIGAYIFSRPGYATKCDNIIECNDSDDECNKTVCPNSNISACNYIQYNKGFVCPNSGSGLLGKEICDGYPTCYSTQPHLSADEYNCTNRFYCADHGKSGLPIHIRLSQRCNQITDCKDISDEMGCNASVNFYCKSGMPKYVPRYKVCDGVQDCLNGEDECQNCATSPFSSDSFLISSYVLQVIVWVTGLGALIGNSMVIVHNVKRMCDSSTARTSVGFVNRLLVLNLALADFVLGVYLVGLGVVNSVYANIYCRRDVQWRGSPACSVLGCLAVISTETSVFTLTIMASYRLFVVYKPFVAGKKPWIVGLIAATAWFAAMILAFVPLATSQKDYFVSGLWYQRNLFLATPNRTFISNFVRALRTFQDPIKRNFTHLQPNALTWNTITSTVATLRHKLMPQLYFGYYSAHGVCLPRLFPIPSIDRSWGYSLMIIIINFCAFVYMVAAYITIYKKTQARAKRVGKVDGGSPGLQKKISRIVVTNFCCWMPICIMAFISVGGVTMSKTAYSVAAIVLLPINSASNPFLYSDLPDIIWAKIKPVRDSINSWTTEVGSYSRERKRSDGNDADGNSKLTETHNL